MDNLKHDSHSRDTVQCLQELLIAAQRGKILGIAFIAMMVDGYIANTAGAVRERAHEARHMLGALDEQLENLANGKTKI